MARFNLLLAILGFLPLVLAQRPALPLSASSRWILDANGNRIKFRCVNWPAHMEPNVPEGLHRQSMDYLVSWIKRNNFNCVRLTYSIDHALNPSITVRDSFNKAATDANVPLSAMQTMYREITQLNPWITNSTTTGDVFAALVDKLWEQEIPTILDNHVSRAQWCCNINDGNGWWDKAFGYNTWNSRFFNTANWLAGLQAMAAWSQSRKGVVAMSLRNELRAFLLQDLNGRQDWYHYIKTAGDLVHDTHPDVLILVGGSQSSTDLTHLRNRMLDNASWKHKTVWEMHAYSFTVTFPDAFKSCDVVKAQYGLWSGFVLEQNRAYTGPMILSEFGVGMQGGGLENGLSEKDDRYLRCLVDYMKGNDADWAVWALAGSYYVREGVVDYEETWGLLGRDWKDWRNEGFKDMLGDMWRVTQGPGRKRGVAEWVRRKVWGGA
ncbi:hypothetical protein OQA88_9220 [Cercophora sp. LCS_1]